MLVVQQFAAPREYASDQLFHDDRGEEMVFTIADDGMAMNGAACDRVFTLFIFTRVRKGTGLGLFNGPANMGRPTFPEHRLADGVSKNRHVHLWFEENVLLGHTDGSPFIEPFMRHRSPVWMRERSPAQQM